MSRRTSRDESSASSLSKSTVVHSKENKDAGMGTTSVQEHSQMVHEVRDTLNPGFAVLNSTDATRASF